MFACLECGRKFKSVKAAQRAANNGCPNCGGVDVDLYVPPPAAARCPHCHTVPFSHDTCYCGATSGKSN